MPDTIRCPKCAKNNPAGTETCKFCGTRLNAPDKPGPAQPASSAPDWLNDLRASSGGEDDSLPWMDASAGQAGNAGDDLPDWLAEISAPPKVEPSPAAPPAASSQSNVDWLTGLSDNLESPARPIQDAGVDDWLASLRDEPGEPSQAAPATPSQREPAPLPAPMAGDSLPSAGEDPDLAEWLKSLDPAGGTSVFTTATSQPEPEFKWTDASDKDAKTQETGVTEWLTGIAYEPPPKEEKPSPDSVSFDTWLADDRVLREQDDAPAPSAAQASPASEAMPDWAAMFSDTSPSEETPAPSSSASPASPAWLSSLAPQEPASSASQTASDVGGTTMPDWLSGFTAEEAPAPSFSQSESQPDWLAGFGDELSQQTETTGQELPLGDAGQPSAPEPPARHIPDFATLFSTESIPAQPREIQAAPVPAQSTEPVQPIPALTPEPSRSGEPEPDWLAAFAEAAQTPALGEAALGGTGSMPFIDPQAPDWLSGVQPPASQPILAGPPALFEEAPQPQPDLESPTPFQVDLPDWLEPNKPAEREVSAESSELSEELAQAELPGWVQDMRPLESVIPGIASPTSDPQKVEKAGPLAGMRGILAPEEPVSHFRKLPAYSARLKVTERQRTHASLLQNVLDLEAQPFAVSTEPSQTPQFLYRLVVAAVLILALLAGMFLRGTNLFPPPVPGSSDTGLLALYNEIESVPPGAPVLVAVDFEPALAGEMRMVSSTVIEHLMVRGANIILVSTVPAGPILGQDLLETVQQRKPDYSLAERVVNLGYLPGGTTSLLEFAQRPFNAAPLDYLGYKAWDRPALKGIQTIRNFALVVVLTDSVETGRAWVEQVDPLMGAVPLAMVASAQAGPLLLPYFDSGQITGLLSGFMGGVMYEQHSGRVNLANTLWSSYQTGMMAGIAMLIIGGVISAGINVTRKPRKGKM